MYAQPCVIFDADKINCKLMTIPMKQRKIMRRTGVAVAVVLLLGSALYVGTTRAAREDAPTAHAPRVRVAQVSADAAAMREVVLSGAVRAPRQVMLAPKASGRVMRLLVDTGDRVRAGQLIAVIDGTEMWAQTRVADTGAQTAANVVSKTRAYYDAQVKQAKKARDLARKAYSAARASGDAAAIAQAEANYELAKKAYKAAKRARDAQVVAARAQRDVARAQATAARTAAANTYLRAPFSGVIAARMVEVGDLVSPERPIVTLVSGSERRIDLDASRDVLAHVRVGMTVAVRHGSGTQEEATVTRASSIVDPLTQKGLVRVVLPRETKFAIGETARVIFHVPLPDVPDGAVAVPRAALTPVAHDYRVWTVDGDGIAHARIVRVESVGADTAIVSGLDADARVIVAGSADVVDGSAVEVVTQ